MHTTSVLLKYNIHLPAKTSGQYFLSIPIRLQIYCPAPHTICVFRGRCYTPTEFKYKQFTTLCPKLSTLTITDLTYNKAMVNWTSNYTGNAILEYSADNVTWTLIDETRTMFPLIPAKQYFVRGSMACTDINSDFISTSFTTPCPKVSTLYVDTVTPFSAKVNWADESDTDNYTLTYSMTAGGTVTTVETSSTSFTLDGLNPRYAVYRGRCPTMYYRERLYLYNF